MDDYSQLPGRFLFLVLFAIMGVVTLATWYEIDQPCLGLSLKSTRDGIVVTDSRGPAESIPVGAQIVALVSNSKRIDLQANDMLLDPDVLDTYEQLNVFFDRQSILFSYLQNPVEVIWKTVDSSEKKLTIHPQKRLLRTLPLFFWLSFIIGAIACLIGCWVWVLRPSDWGTRMYAITGLMFFATVLPIAIYCSRPLALNGEIFRMLSGFNHLAVLTFGTALIGMFLTYPHMLIKPHKLILAPLGYWLIWICDFTQRMPNIDWGHRFPVISEFLLAVFLSFIQWRKCRSKPVERASLRWFLIFVLSACSLTIIPYINNAVFGYKIFINSASIVQEPIFALGALLIMYVGIAVGLRRYRLFDLDEWAYSILLWVGGAILVILIDSTFVFLLNPDRTLSLAVTLIISGLIYFPLRQLLWLRYVTPTRMTTDLVMPNIIQIAFVDSTIERGRLWEDLLRSIYNPLEFNGLDTTVEKVILKSDGLEMHLPSCGELPAKAMRYPNQGHRLFTKRDVSFVGALCLLMENASSARIAYEQGVIQERHRISRDMHDDIGARLLQLIHRAKDESTAEIARAAVRDLRTALNALDSKPALMADALADWRLEIETRCESANVKLIWLEPEILPEHWFSAIERSTLERVLREMLSNALRHASPAKIEIKITFYEGAIYIALSNDIKPVVEKEWTEGRGLGNIRSRLGDVGGDLSILHKAEQVVFTISLPIDNNK